MISLFRKHIASRLAVRATVSMGILTCFAAFAAAPAAHAQAAAPTRTQLASQQQNGVLSFTAMVHDVEGQPVSEGSVSFETAKGSLGSVFVQNGVATLNVTNPPDWARTVTAVYHGDSAFASSEASATVVGDQSSTVAGFTVTASPSSFTVSPGQYETVNLTLTSRNGFSQQVNLSCSGLPSSAECNFNPVIATPPANGSILSSLQITTQGSSGILSSHAERLRRSGTAYALVIPGLLALAGMGALRRRHFGALRVLGIAMLLAAGAIGLTACNPRYSYEHYQPSPNYGTAPGNYTIVISAYSSNGTAITQATSPSGCSGAVCVAMTVK
ncbi:MAG TPA: Ig-like domain repeat protein [Acidobacteriaceae bacterium]|nr:Ig-like domain repeat protein [Acidobacteriaceae bacterium]